MEEPGKSLWPAQDVGHGRGHGVLLRQAGAILTHPGQQVIDHGRDALLPHGETLRRRCSIDGALGLEDRVDQRWSPFFRQDDKL